MNTIKYLHIVAGLHEGARLDLSAGEHSIGCSEECDFVLSDAGVAAHHLRVLVEKHGVTFEPLNDASLQHKDRLWRTQATRARDYEIYGIGAARFYLCPAATQETRAGAFAASSPAAQRGRPTKLAYAACALFAAAGLFTYAEDGWLRRQPDPAALLAQARSTLAALELPDLNVQIDASQRLVISGFVQRTQDAQRLQRDTRLRALGTPVLRVHVAEQLLNRLQQDLDAPQVRADYAGNGTIVLRGSAAAGLRTRVTALRTDLAQVVKVEDRIDYRAAPAAQSAGANVALPVRIVAVHVGAISYFEDAEGARYFIGGSLRDGAQVTAISESSISFSKNGRSITHLLNEAAEHARL
jgi:hypothetical protein